MKKLNLSIVAVLCAVVLCSNAAADAGSAFRAMRKQQLAADLHAPITALPIKFGDDEDQLYQPPGPAGMVEPQLVKLKSRYFLPDLIWLPDQFEGTRHIYVRLAWTDPRACPKMLEKHGFKVKKSCVTNSTWLRPTTTAFWP